MRAFPQPLAANQYERSSASGADVVALLAEELVSQQLKEATVCYGVLLLLFTRKRIIASAAQAKRRAGAGSASSSVDGGAAAGGGLQRQGSGTTARPPSPFAALPQLPFVRFGGGAAAEGAGGNGGGGVASGKGGGGNEEEEAEGLRLDDIDYACEAFLGRRFGFNVSSDVSLV